MPPVLAQPRGPGLGVNERLVARTHHQWSGKRPDGRRLARHLVVRGFRVTLSGCGRYAGGPRLRASTRAALAAGLRCRRAGIRSRPSRAMFDDWSEQARRAFTVQYAPAGRGDASFFAILRIQCRPLGRQMCRLRPSWRISRPISAAGWSRNCSLGSSERDPPRRSVSGDPPGMKLVLSVYMRMHIEFQRSSRRRGHRPVCQSTRAIGLARRVRSSGSTMRGAPSSVAAVRGVLR